MASEAPKEIYIIPGTGTYIEPKEAEAAGKREPVKYIRADLVASLWAMKL